MTEKEIDALVAIRDQARRGQDYEMADFIRNQLKESNVIVEDTTFKTTWRRK